MRIYGPIQDKTYYAPFTSRLLSCCKQERRFIEHLLHHNSEISELSLSMPLESRAVHDRQ
jgi:hypothetical protein